MYEDQGWTDRQGDGMGNASWQDVRNSITDGACKHAP